MTAQAHDTINPTRLVATVWLATLVAHGTYVSYIHTCRIPNAHKRHGNKIGDDTTDHIT
jgi:hypothetical protein